MSYPLYLEAADLRTIIIRDILKEKKVASFEDLTDTEKLICEVFRFDCYYPYSDDASVYRSGAARAEVLKTRVKESNLPQDLSAMLLSRIDGADVRTNPTYRVYEWLDSSIDQCLNGTYRRNVYLYDAGVTDVEYDWYSQTAKKLTELLTNKGVRYKLFWSPYVAPLVFSKKGERGLLRQLDEKVSLKGYFIGVAQTEQHQRELNRFLRGHEKVLKKMLTSKIKYPRYEYSYLESFGQFDVEPMDRLAKEAGLDPTPFVGYVNVRARMDGNGVIIKI